MRDKILIYRDYGCADVNTLEQGLKEYFEPKGCKIGFTDAAGIIKDNELNENVLAFFMPGGAGTPFRRKLEVLGNEKIRSYIRAAASITASAPAPIMHAGKRFLKKTFQSSESSANTD